jgi:hypothetical protein
MFNFYNVPAMKYIFDDIDIAGAPTANQPGFLADVSNLRYSQTNNKVEFVTLKHASFARKHILASYGPAHAGLPGNSLVIQQPDSDDADLDNLRVPSKQSGVFLTSKGGSISLQATDSTKRSVILGDKGLLLAADAASLDGKPQVFLSDDAVHVKLKDSFIEIKEGDVSLFARSGGDNAFVHLKAGQIGIYSSKNQIELGLLKVNNGNVTGIDAINEGAIKFIQGPNAVMATSTPTVTAPTLAGDKRTLA